MAAKRTLKAIRVRGLNQAQRGIVDDEQARVGLDLTAGATFIEGTREQLEDLADGIEIRLDDDHEFFVEGGSMNELTEHQVAFGAKQLRAAIENTVKNIRRATARHEGETR